MYILNKACSVLIIAVLGSFFIACSTAEANRESIGGNPVENRNVPADDAGNPAELAETLVVSESELKAALGEPVHRYDQRC